jgi:pimeloyl-ACP methyl ester carboxylesterase
MTLSSPAKTPLEIFNWSWQGHQIAYTVMGEGPSLLLIHGFGASIGHWRHNIPVLAAAGYRVFALDLLGFGASDKAARDYSLELWQELIQDFWQEKIQQPTIFIGNSIGALLSLMLASNLQSISRGAVLINCAGGLNHRSEELNPVLGLMMNSFTKAVALPVLGDFIFNQVRRKSQIKRTLSQVYCTPDAITDELVEILHRPSCDPGARAVFANILQADPGPTPESLLAKLTHPLLVLWGENDPWTPIKGSGIYRDRDDVEFHAIPNAGHCPHDEKPEIVNELIIDWLGRIS